ncbi:amidohydrolase [Bosea sp. PAMC 26642]|uniref:amidohydrolase n=1 Tax=Bosea sp. (strain PAMC 26642) TaxID=1792307 RepID=UPI0009E8276B|nr:amidohydrolase [Bosea sp. PAMC 26642]
MDRSLLDRLTVWRRHLHAHPELSLYETQTSAFVQEKLAEMGIPFVAGVGGNGVVATLTRGTSDRSVGLRADMDALPINEANDLPYRSGTADVMHACGHDGHTVSLLGAAALLAKDESWSGTVQFLFQASEENGAGARAMIADGLFERFPMERVFGLHNWPGLEAGTVAVHRGPVMAEPGRFTITLHGSAGHAAKPDLTRDPIVAMGHLIVALQTIVSRNIDPMESAVVSIGQVHGGLAPNQIPTSVFINGTYRTFKPAVRDRVLQRLQAIAENIAATFEMRAEVAFITGGLATINTPLEEEVAATAGAVAGLAVRRDMPASNTGEDFAHYLQHRPGAYVWIGNGPVKDGGELHNDRYDFNDAILPATAGWLAAVARQALEGELLNVQPVGRTSDDERRPSGSAPLRGLSGMTARGVGDVDVAVQNGLTGKNLR